MTYELTTRIVRQKQKGHSCDVYSGVQDIWDKGCKATANLPRLPDVTPWSVSPVLVLVSTSSRCHPSSPLSPGYLYLCFVCLCQFVLFCQVNQQDKQAQTDWKHRYKYPGDNGEDGWHLEGVETSTRTGETDQGVVSFHFKWRKHLNKI